MPWRQLAELMLMLLTCTSEHYEWSRKELAEVVMELVAAAQLPPGAACELFSGLLDRKLGTAWWGVNCKLQKFAVQLTGSEVLQLLQQAAKVGCDPAIHFFAALDAAGDNEDAEGFAAFLQAALVHGIQNGTVAQAVAGLPAVQQLQPDAVLDILQGWVSSSTCHTRTVMYDFLVDHPALDSFSTWTIQQLLLQAEQQQRLAAVSGLLLAPAAEQLLVAVLVELLQCAMQERHVWEAVSSSKWDELLQTLIDLPAAAQLPAHSVVAILAAPCAFCGSHTGSSLRILWYPYWQQQWRLATAKASPFCASYQQHSRLAQRQLQACCSRQCRKVT
jgi:hypothetical protein